MPVVSQPASTDMLLTDEELLGIVEFPSIGGLTMKRLVAKAQLLKVQKSEDAIRVDQRAKDYKEIGEWIEKHGNFELSYIPECGADLCFLATEGFENECAEPEEGAGHCKERERCRLWNESILKHKKILANLKSGQHPEGEK
jgi:hypothetical protein